ncbi:MAG: PqqD family protein [Rhodospirillales bacterium]|nr:PqqD family protein [Rhodospirillales bacterium]
MGQSDGPSRGDAVPRKGVSLHLLGDQGVLFDLPAQRLYAANTTASFIWCCLEERRPLRETCERLADTFGLRLADAETYVEGMVTQWRDLGLIDGGPYRGG